MASPHNHEDRSDGYHCSFEALSTSLLALSRLASLFCTNQEYKLAIQRSKGYFIRCKVKRFVSFTTGSRTFWFLAKTASRSFCSFSFLLFVMLL